MSDRHFAQTMWARWAAARRRRSLAGDDRAGSWARDRARDRWYAFVRLRWRLLLAMTSVAGVPITGLALLIHNTFLRGVIVGAGVAGTIAVLCNLVVQATGTAVLTAGATAEQWTAQELRRLQKDGYRLINRVLVGQGDTDHVLVGPAGVLVVETKWTSHTWTLSVRNAYRDAALTQLDDRVNRLTRWSAYQRCQAPMPRAVLFLWSPHGTTPSEETPSARLQINSRHTIVWGRAAAAEWREKLRGAPAVLSSELVERVATTLVAQTETQEAAEGTEKVPPSITRLYWSVLGVVLAFLAAAVVSVDVVSHAAAPWWTLTLILEAAVGAVAARARRVRPIATAWLAGVAVVTVLAAVSAVVSSL